MQSNVTSPLSPGASPGPDTSTLDPFRPAPATEPSELPQQPHESVTPTRIQFSIRLRFNPIRNLTPELLSQYLDSFRLGFFRNPALTWDAMERRDTRIQTVAAKRKKSVSRHGWEILAMDDSPEAAAQKAFLEYFYNHLSVITALEPDEEGEMSLLLRQMMDAVGKRYAVHEIVWQPQADGNLTAKFIFCPLWWFEGTQGKLRFLLNEFSIYGVDMEPGGWLVTVGDGIMEACSVAYIFKQLPMRDWLSYSEKFGMPGVTGETPAAKDSPEWNAMVEAVESFSSDWSAVFNSGGKISLIEASGKGDQPFKPLVDLMNEEITRLWRGSDLGTSSKKDGVGASLQGDESDILEVDDALLLTETLERKVSKFARQWKFGDAPPLAYIKIKVSEAANTELDLKVDQFLLDNGFPISKSSAGQRYGRELPPKSEELLAPIAAPPAAAPVEASIANDQRAAASDKLIARGKQAFAAAVQEDLSHVLSRLNDIMNIQDGELFLNKLQQFAADYPAFKKDILADPAAARALQPILGAALANGLAAGGAEMANGDLPGHEFHGNQHTGGLGGSSGASSGRNQVGKSGTAKELGLPDAKDLPAAANAPHRMDLGEAKTRLGQGFSHKDPLGRDVKFGQIAQRHFEHPHNQRAERVRFLNSAEQTVKQPAEVWEHNHRHYYIGVHTLANDEGKPSRGFTVAAARKGETKNEAITFHPKKLNELKSFRKGKLLYASY